jgi:amidophosphoribosyltransferase
MIGADSLAYTSIEGMIKAIGMPRSNLCLGCVTGEYPVPIEGERERGQQVLDAFESEKEKAVARTTS